MTDFIDQYKNELLNSVLPFWMRHSRDDEQGGFFSCLLRDGTVYDTDKFVWLQARQTGTFAMLYNRLEKRQEWLEMARHGARFLEKHGRDEQGNWYFALNRAGAPLVQPYNVFSDCFAALAFGELYKATGEERYAEIARQTFQRVIRRRDNPKGKYNKAYPGTRELKNFALPMILSHLALELEDLLEEDLVQELTRDVIIEVMDVFYQTEEQVVLENVTQKGGFSDSFDGRLLNPGHAIEAMWFVMDLGERMGDRGLIVQAAQRALRMIEYGWDEEYGGIFYFMDIKGYPPQQLEWDRKLWWVHLESLVAMLKGWRHTGEEDFRKWFERLHEYTWPRFTDAEHGEWFGYLNRRGERLSDLKGGKWKGCFHVPRALYQCWRELELLRGEG